MLEIVKRHLAAFTAGDWAAFRHEFSEDAEYCEIPTQRHAYGPEAITRVVSAWKASFPDLRATIETAVEGDDAVFSELRWEGTHRGVLEGPFGPIEPTGERGVVPAVMVNRFRGEKIVSMHLYFDILTVLAQIGAMGRLDDEAPSGRPAF